VNGFLTKGAALSRPGAPDLARKQRRDDAAIPETEPRMAQAPPARQPINDPLMHAFQSKLERVRSAGPFELPLAVKDLCEIAATLLRDQQSRIAALERKT